MPTAEISVQRDSRGDPRIVQGAAANVASSNQSVGRDDESEVELPLVVDGVVTVGLIPGDVINADRRDVLTMTLDAVFGPPAVAYCLEKR